MFRMQVLTNVGQKLVISLERLKSKTTVGVAGLIQRFGIFYIGMGYLLGRALILQELSPFAAAYFIVVYFLRRDKVLLTGLALLLGAASRSVELATIVFINLALSFLILRIQEKWKKRELNQAPLIVLATIFFSGIIYQFFTNQLSVYSTVMKGIEAILGMILTLIFVQSLPFLTSKKYHHELRTEEIVCIVILLASVMTGTVGWHIEGASVQGILAKYSNPLFGLYWRRNHWSDGGGYYRAHYKPC